MILERKLSTLRKQKGLSQEDLAIQLNISRQAVYKWENGQSIPDIDNLKILSKIFNVSLDNLLDDNADIVYRSDEKKQLSYGNVSVFATPSSDSAEKDNTTLLPKEEKKAKTRKIIMRSCAGIFWSIPAAFCLMIIIIILTVIFETPETTADALSTICSYVIVFSLFLSLIALPVWLIAKKLLPPEIEIPRTYFKETKEKIENALTEKGYSFLPLQPDLLQYFFYDKQNESFGFYFDDKEQFLCPIQNYINYDYQAETEKEVPTGTKTRFGLILGSLSGIGLHRESKTENCKQTHFRLSLKYHNEHGEIKKYEFLLTTIRNYSIKFYNDPEGMLMHWNAISGATAKTQQEIKERLDYEKAKYL